MSGERSVGLAQRADATSIALLSRDAVEHGLRWTWTPSRVRQAIADRSTNVVVARENLEVIGFALMEYDLDDAHLLLLGVAPSHRRRGLASALLAWLEDTLRLSGIARLRAEVRETNEVARAFYRSLGFSEVGLSKGYYLGVENAVQMMRRVHCGS